MKPQLAQIAKDVASLLDSDSWVMEQKFDGDRFLVCFDGPDSVRTFSRRGTETAVPRIKTARHTLDLSPIKGNHDLTIFDGEIMPEGVFHVFDVLSFRGTEVLDWTLEARRAILERTVAQLQDRGFHLVPQYHGGDKAPFLAEITAANLEGVMFKRLGSKYKMDHRSKDWLKHKLYKSCSVIITELCREGKPESVTVCLYDGHEVSGCKIPIRYQEELGIQVGDVIDVKYLSVTKDWKITQPTFLKKRTDISPQDCTKEQLKYASQGSEAWGSV